MKLLCSLVWDIYRALSLLLLSAWAVAALIVACLGPCRDKPEQRFAVEALPARLHTHRASDDFFPDSDPATSPAHVDIH